MKPPPSTSALLKRLSAAWKPFGIERECAKGASRASLARVAKLGTVPRDLLDLLAWHDGSRVEIDGYYKLLSCAGIVRSKKLMDDMIEEFEDGEGEVVSYVVNDAARPRLHRSLRHWLGAITEMWEHAPPGASEDERCELERPHERGYPIRRRARQKPAKRTPKPAAYATCERGPYEFRIECTGATVTTMFGRGISRRRHTKTFASPEQAQAYTERHMELKLRDGFKRTSE